MRNLHHKYWLQEQLGMSALRESDCPYRMTEIGKRCAWLAGFRDKQSRFAGEPKIASTTSKHALRNFLNCCHTQMGRRTTTTSEKSRR